MAKSRNVFVVAGDGQKVELPEDICLMSQVLKDLIGECPDADTFPMPNVDFSTLCDVRDILIQIKTKHIEYQSKTLANYNNLPPNCINVIPENTPIARLTDIINAANFLNISMVIDMAVDRYANLLPGLSIDEVQRKFGYFYDFTEEEEEIIRNKFYDT